MEKRENKIYLTRQELLVKYPDSESVFYDEEVLMMLRFEFFIQGVTILELEDGQYEITDIDNIPEKNFVHSYEEQSVLDFLEYRNARLIKAGVRD